MVIGTDSRREPLYMAGPVPHSRSNLCLQGRESGYPFTLVARRTPVPLGMLLLSATDLHDDVLQHQP